MLVGGVLGALILPPLSDKNGKRKPFLIVCMVLMIPGLIGLTGFTDFVPMLISAFIFGFFIMSAGSIGFQYGTEKSYPAPESTSQGIILMVGQISGIIFVFGVNKFGGGNCNDIIYNPYHFQCFSEYTVKRIDEPFSVKKH